MKKLNYALCQLSNVIYWKGWNLRLESDTLQDIHLIETRVFICSRFVAFDSYSFTQKFKHLHYYCNAALLPDGKKLSVVIEEVI